MPALPSLLAFTSLGIAHPGPGYHDFITVLHRKTSIDCVAQFRRPGRKRVPASLLLLQVTHHRRHPGTAWILICDDLNFLLLHA